MATVPSPATPPNEDTASRTPEVLFQAQWPAQELDDTLAVEDELFRKSWPLAPSQSDL